MKIKWWHIAVFSAIVLIIAAILFPTKMRTAWMHQEGGEIDESIEEVRKLYKNDPNNYRALRTLAQGYEKLGKTTKAEEFYEELIKIKPIDNNFKETIRFYAWTQQPEGVMKTLRRWYEQRIKDGRDFTDNEGIKLLRDLYAYDLLYKNYDEAIELLGRMKMLTPKVKFPFSIDMDLFTLYERTGDLDSAIKQLDIILKNDRKNKYAVKKFMEIAPFAGKEKEAEELLASYIKEEPSNMESWQKMIQFETSLNKLGEAGEWFDKMLERFSGNGSVQRKYVEWLLNTRQEKMAITFLEKIIDQGEKDPFYYDTLVKLYEWNNVKDKLLPIYMSRFKEDPSDRKNAKEILSILSTMKNTDAEKVILEKLVSIYPGDVEFGIMLVGIYDTEKDNTAATALLERIAGANHSQEVLKLLGEHYLWNNQTQKAYDIFLKLIQEKPSEPDIYKYMGDIYMDRGDRKEAIEYFEKYSAMMPNDYYPHYRLGEIYRLMNDKNESDRELEIALSLMHSDLTVQMTRARIYGLLGKKDESMAGFESLLAEYPDNIDLINTYIETLLDTGNTQKASAVSLKYRLVAGQDIRYKKNLARIYTNEKKYSEAEELYLALLEKEPNNIALKSDYAYMTYEKGNWYKARQMFEEIGEIDPGNADIKAVLKDIFINYSPNLVWGFGYTRIGGENRYGPYVRFNYPINFRWSFEAAYLLDRDKANVVGYDSNYKTLTNDVELVGKYKPHKTVSMGVGFLNQLIDKKYIPAPRFIFDWNNPVYGRFNLDYIYNKVLSDPTSALYFDGVTDKLHTYYEKIFIERIIFIARYQSNWYRIDAAKTGRGGGDNYGREDVAGTAISFILLKKPEVRLGYDFNYSNLHIVNNYMDIIPLIKESERNDITAGFYHEWNKYLITDLSAFVGNDSKRDLKLSQLDLYGFNFTQRVKPSKRFEIAAHYEYSSESLQNNVGRYQNAWLEFLYRF